MPFFFPIINQWNTLSWHSNKSAQVAAINNSFADANVKNTSAKFQLNPTYSLLNVSPNFSLLVSMATTQI